MDAEQRTYSEPVRNAEPERTGSFYAPKALVVGLTGGIATGKSTVADMLAEKGAEVISADTVVHRMLQHDSRIQEEIVREFGDQVLTPEGAISRRALGEIVFRDPEKRKRLESIIHPHVLRELAERAEEFRQKREGVLVLEIPLLIEAGALDMVDKVLVVVAEQETQMRRLEKRNGITREEALLRIAAQMPLKEKVRYGDWVVRTDGTLRSTKERVSEVWADIQKSLAQPK